MLHLRSQFKNVKQMHVMSYINSSVLSNIATSPSKAFLESETKSFEMSKSDVNS
ncbi:hypothetical protein HMI55_005277, partial [Coelomomyces lativittatus]